MKSKGKRFIISWGIVLSLFSLLLVLLYPGKGKLGHWFAVSAVFTIARDSALYAGMGLLFIRLIKIISPLYQIYIFGCTINIAIGLIGVVLYWLSSSQMTLGNACLYNLLLGVIFLGDIMLYKS
jgi:hypothetical protein